MAITVSPNPVNLQWSNFRTVPGLPDEEAHVDINFNVPNRPFRQVNGQFMMAETFQIGVSPVVKVVQGASQTAELLSHEQGHYNLGHIGGLGHGPGVYATSGPESGCSGHGDSKLLHAA